MFLARLAYVSIHAPREGCDGAVATEGWSVWVSIHAPREGCDARTRHDCARKGSFNSRTPGGVRQRGAEMSRDERVFQFTHPGRGATGCPLRCGCCRASFNSRTPGGVRRTPSLIIVRQERGFNSRTPGGVRRRALITRYFPMQFQFTHPGRGATLPRYLL